MLVAFVTTTLVPIETLRTTNQDLLVKHLVEKVLTPQAHNPDVSDEFAALIVRMLAKKREDRPRDFHEVLMKLRTIKVFKNEEKQQGA